jgi:hypothetical protein
MATSEFEKFMAEVNHHLAKASGFTAFDLSDYGYWDAFESEMPPAEVAAEVLAENGMSE